jgi:hypothetical protein
MKRSHLALLLAIIAVNLVFKLQYITYSSFDLDEAVHIWYAQLPLPEVIAQASNDPNPPLFNILISGWIKLFGVTEFATRCFSLLFSALAAGALFIFLKRNMSLRIAMIAVTLFTVSAIQVRFAHNARPYTMLVFLVICSYGMLLELMRKPSVLNYAGYLLATTLMLYAHPTSIFNLPAQALFLLPQLRSHFRTVATVGFCQVLAVGGYLLWHLNIPYFKTNPGTWLHPPTLHDALIHIRYLNGKDETDLLFFLQLALALVGVILLWRFKNKENYSSWYLALCWTLIPFLGNFAYSHIGQPIFQGKYVISSQLGMLVLMAVSIDSLRWQTLRWATFGAVVAFMVSVINWKSTSGEDWRGASKYVVDNDSPTTATFISPWFEFRSFAYYFDSQAYLDPHITQKVLVAKRVFTAWHDVIPVGSNRPLFKRLHFVHSQPGAENQQPRLDSLMKNAALVAQLKLEGITIYTFDLRVPPPTMYLDFESGTSPIIILDSAKAFSGSGAEQLDKDHEYSSALVFPLEEAFAKDANVNVSAQVRCDAGLQEVFLVASVIRNGEYLANIQMPVNASAMASTKWQELTLEFRYDKAKFAGADLKVFVWNPSKKTVWVDELKIAAKP